MLKLTEKKQWKDVSETFLIINKETHFICDSHKDSRRAITVKVLFPPAWNYAMGEARKGQHFLRSIYDISFETIALCDTFSEYYTIFIMITFWGFQYLFNA